MRRKNQQTPEFKQSRIIEKVPFFYGWIIFAIGTLGIIMTSPGQTYGVSIFIEHFISDLGISRSTTSTLYMAGTLIGSFSLPIVGKFIDNRGVRSMMVLVSVLFGLACIYMGYVANAIMLGVGFALIRMLGQSSLALVSKNAINLWWVKQRGKVNGLSGMLAGLIALGGFPFLVHSLIPQLGWEYTYMLLGGVLIVVLAPLAWFFVRNKPEEYGLLPDGASGTSPVTKRSTVSEENWTLSEAIKTRAFWLVIIPILAVSILSTALFFHMVSIIKDAGLSESVAATVFVPIAITNAVVTLIGGYLVDKYDVKYLLAVTSAMQFICVLLPLYLTSTSMALLYGVVMGATGGLTRSVGMVVWANYFGRTHLGSISGVADQVLIIGSAIGPMIFGIARDLAGSYHDILMFSSIYPLVCIAGCFFIQKPQKTDLSQ